MGGSEGQAAAGLALHTGAITLLSTDGERPAQQLHQPLTAAEAAAHLSGVIKQRRIAARLGGAAAAASGSSQDAAAAVAAVEQLLLYQRFEFSVAELRAEASLPAPPVGGSGGAPDGDDRPAPANGSGFARQWHPVLQRMRVGGGLKLHRVAQVGLRGVCCTALGWTCEQQGLCMRHPCTAVLKTLPLRCPSSAPAGLCAASGAVRAAGGPNSPLPHARRRSAAARRAAAAGSRAARSSGARRRAPRCMRYARRWRLSCEAGGGSSSPCPAALAVCQQQRRRWLVRRCCHCASG